MKQKKYDSLDVQIFPSRDEMGKTAAADAASCILSLLEKKQEINCIFAAAPSQNDFLDALVHMPSIPWNRINAYHMDEYVGLAQKSEASFSGFLDRSIFSKVPFNSVNFINGMNVPEEETKRYGLLLDAHKVDIVFMGIGENGHIAFNDPEVADFNDRETIKLVKLDEICRKQQVHDKCFPNLAAVPTHAFTVTIPALVRAPHLFCIVPTKLKAQAVKNALEGPISEKCPASILRRQPDAHMYLDADAAMFL